MLKKCVQSDGISLSLKWIFTFYSIVCRRRLRKPGHCKGFVFITSEVSQDKKIPFILIPTRHSGMCRDAMYWYRIQRFVAVIYLSRGFVRKESNVKKNK
jgi:hypothetical protein